ncbi:MAG: DTW domain-containing protein [Candidatus Aminicenantes bacterium]|nr:DTW domain-containing protein [Candidatus Aminicenantes bacterium]
MNYRDFCYTCRRPKKTCLCSLISPIKTDTHFVLLMHPKESRKQKLGTGRLTHLYLENSLLIEGVDFSDDPEINKICASQEFYPIVLYPGRESQILSENLVKDIRESSRKLLVFVIDATWKQAKKIMLLSKNLQSLPQIRVHSEKGSRFYIKTQPGPVCVSTIEAVYYTLVRLKTIGFESEDQSYEGMMELLDTLCHIQEKYALDISMPGYRKTAYSPPPNRISPIKNSNKNYIA